VSPEEKRETVAMLQAAVEVSRYSGPLPKPEDLAKYEQVLTGSADPHNPHGRATGHASSESRNACRRIECCSSKVGLVCAFVIALSAIVGGILLSLKGMSGAGLASIISALGALVSVFIYGKSAQKRELMQKSDELTRASADKPTA
jgi:uncharacterized membrane protein